MGGVVSSLFGWVAGSQPKACAPENMGPEADIPDPDSSLTQRECAYLRSTWALVKPDMRAHGIKFFILLFTTHPHLQQKFKPFAGKTIEELADSKRLAGHATTVMTAIDSYVENLDDVSCVVEMLKTTGINHKNRGITLEDFAHLYPVLIQYLGQALGSAWSEGARLAWAHLTKVIHSVIAPGFEGK